MKKHFVTFYSPGTIVSEESTKEIDTWSPQLACELAHGISERYGATPYAFKFTTRERGENDLDSKVVATSPRYFLGGKIETRAEIIARHDPAEKILCENMRVNNIDRVLVNDNSYRSTHVLRDDDVVLDWKPREKKQ